MITLVLMTLNQFGSHIVSSYCDPKSRNTHFISIYILQWWDVDAKVITSCCRVVSTPVSYSRVQIYAWRLAILTEVFRVFPLSLQEYTEIVT
jgi:hypothetical protein